MLAEFGEFLEKIIASTWNMLNSSSPWIIFSFWLLDYYTNF